eukprot:COSAG01_NODE_4857_length_4679_cov_2.341485_5_plen_63_part_00
MDGELHYRALKRAQVLDCAVAHQAPSALEIGIASTVGRMDRRHTAPLRTPSSSQSSSTFSGT